MTESNGSSQTGKPVRLPTLFKEKVWGSTELAPWYPEASGKVGEVWFMADLPLLIKFVFTTEKLSVQVHPDDAFAAEHESSRGKTEMWHVLRADPGAQVALGFREAITPERMRDASLSGEIEQLLQWIDVEAGDTFFTPAGTVHAIGGGLVLCEIQQNSDVTYRLYDYGRPRELHLDKAMRVAHTSAHSGEPAQMPVRSPYFQAELQEFDKASVYQPDPARFQCLIMLEGEGMIGNEPYRLGETWLVPAAASSFPLIPSSPTRMIRTWVP